jgi:phage shock protein A
MSESRNGGIIRRFTNLVAGLFTGWIRDRENHNPRAIYEQAITERTRQYAELKQGVAGILYMRNKLEAEISQRRAEVKQARDDITRAVRNADDEVALELISHKESLVEDLERSERELEEVRGEVEGAKGNLIKFRSEIRQLEREKVRMLATLANAKARRRIQEAIEGLSLDSEMRALEQVRENIERLKTEGRLEQELGDTGLQTRIRQIRRDARDEAAQRELDELKRRLRPEAIEAPRSVTNGRAVEVETQPGAES